MACAWAGFTAYAVSMVISYFIGQRYYPVSYPLRSMGMYTLAALVVYAAISFSNSHFSVAASLFVNTILILLYVALIIKRDLPLSSLPVVGKYFGGKKH